MAVAAAVVGVVGGLASAFGAGKAGMEAKEASDFNSSLKNSQAIEAIQEGQENERRARIASGKQIGGERAAIAASGIKSEGSALDVLQESASNAELDALTIRHQSQLKAWSYEMGAKADQMEGQSAQTRAGYGVASGLLGGIGSLAGKIK